MRSSEEYLKRRLQIMSVCVEINLVLQELHAEFETKNIENALKVWSGKNSK